jgi:glutamine synthetase
MEEQGNGLHIHMSLVDSTGSNIFPDPTSPLGLSKPAQNFLAGIMSHLPAIAGLTLPTVNSYARANAQGSWSGCHAVTWGRENRECTLRVASPPYGAKCDNVELRCYDSTANPYLGMAAFLACGMDGLEKKMAMPKETIGDPALAKAALMPKNLLAAVENMEKDEVLREMLGEEGMRFNVAMRKYEVEFTSKMSFEEQVKLYIQKV